MDFIQRIKRIDLIQYAETFCKVKVYQNGKAHCPFHPPDNNPSLNFWQNEDGIWFFKDHHDDHSGTIIDFEKKVSNCDESQALGNIATNKGFKNSGEKYYLYTDLDGKPLYWKIRCTNQEGRKAWLVKYENGKCESVPYNLPESVNKEKAIVCEGEKDADTVIEVCKKLGVDSWITSAPNGMSSWPEGINIYFGDVKETTFLYDVGEDAEKNVRGHASKLITEFPEMKIFIAKVPLEKKGADITDYLERIDDKETALKEVLDRAQKFEKNLSLEPKNGKELHIDTLEQFLNKPIPKIERLIDPFLERFGFTFVGGSKGVGKSLFVIQMALYYASGKSGFLNSTIEKPGKVLIIQQEVSESGMQDRLKKMQAEGNFVTQERFSLITTTGNQLDLTRVEEKNKIIEQIEKTQTDVLILDPLYTFFPGELNQAKDTARIIAVLMELKSKYDLSLVVVHHFSNKANPDDLRSTAGRFIGHSNLANAADVTIGIDFLHPRYKAQILPLPYNHYASVETTSRHGEWPNMLYVERGEHQLLFRVSSIWDNIGKKILPDEVLHYLKENGGEMFQQDLITKFLPKAHPNTIRKAIKEAEKMGKLEKDTMPGKHGKKILKLKQQDQGGIGKCC